MGLDFRLLGELRVIADGEPLALGDVRERKVLAVLAVESGRTVPLSRLVDATWDAAPPATAGRQVQNAISRMRGRLGGDVIRSGGGGYRLAVPEDTVDTRVFTDLISRARQLTDDDLAAALLRRALDLWHGPFLDGLSGDVLDAVGAGFEEQRRAVRDRYFGFMLDLGRHREVTGELAAALTDDPLHETTASQLMLALYRCGRVPDALELYARTRRQLGAELGLDPGPELRTLHKRMLDRDPALVREPSRAAANSVPRQLPAVTWHFAGRRAELASLTADACLVLISAIDGTAGVGKTTLAVHWAQQNAARFPDGQLYVNLRGFDPAGQPAAPADVLRGFLTAFGVQPSGMPSGLDELAAMYRSTLAGRRVLIVLDNARDAAQVRPLLPGGTGCTVIVTSRRRLTGLIAGQGAVPLWLDVLSDDEAGELLAGRLGAERVATAATAATELVALCARLPLALAVVAARAAAQPGVPLRRLADELRRARLDALADEDPLTDVRAALDWSYQQLSAAAARLFRLLSLHPGPDFTAQAAASLAGSSPVAAAASLDELASANMLTTREHGRYEFHDLLREYAAERAAAAEDAATLTAATVRLLECYLHLADAAASQLSRVRFELDLPGRPPDGATAAFTSYQGAHAWFETERHVLVTLVGYAAGRGQHRHAWQLAAVLSIFQHRTGYWTEQGRTQRIALAAAQEAGDLVGQATAWNDLGEALRDTAPADARNCYEQAIVFFTRAGHVRGEAQAWVGSGALHDAAGDPAAALRCGQRALRLYTDAGHRPGQANAYAAISWCLARLGRHREALDAGRLGLRLHPDEDGGTRNTAASQWDSLGFSYIGLRDTERALACFRESLTRYRQTANFRHQATVLTHIGDAHWQAGDTVAATEAWRQALAILDELGHPDAEQVRAKLALRSGSAAGW